MSETVTANDGSRRRLPNRRLSENRKLVRGGQSIYLTVGYGPDGLEPKEVFYADGYRSGSDMEALVSDLCIALSVFLQHEGVTVASLRKSMGQTFDLRTGDPMPASILGLILEELSRPPEWADAAVHPEGAEVACDDENTTFGAGDQAAPGSGEAGRRDYSPGPAGAARHHPHDHAPDAAARGGATT